MKKLLQAGELLALYTEASVECAVLLFLLLIKKSWSHYFYSSVFGTRYSEEITNSQP